MVRYLHFISEGELRDQWYAALVEYFRAKNIDNVNIPEMLVGNQNQRSDLVTYICNNGYCSPLFLFEFKNQLKRGGISHHGICQQAFKYSSIVNPYYTICVDLTNYIYLKIYHGNNQVFRNYFQSYADLFNYFFSSFLPQALSVTLNFTIPRSTVINKIFAPPTYERFLRAEFVRILNKNGFCAISECSSIDPQGLNIVKPDLAIYTTSCENEQLLDCEYPFLVLEFKSYYNKTAISQVQKYIDSLLPYYYGVVYGTGNSAEIEIYDRNNNKTLSQSILIGNPYLSDSNVLNLINNLISKLPKVSTPKTPLDGRYNISELVKKGAKVFRFQPNLQMRIMMSGFSIHLDHGGVKYSGHDYSIIIDCPAKLTRLVFFDPNNNLQWCDFQKGRLVRCNINVVAVMISSPCSRLIDKIYP
jgi:hypothetical protein